MVTPVWYLLLILLTALSSVKGSRLVRRAYWCRGTHSVTGYIKRCRNLLHTSWARESAWGQVLCLLQCHGSGPKQRTTRRRTSWTHVRRVSARWWDSWMESSGLGRGALAL